MSSVPRNPAGGSGPDQPERGWSTGRQPLDPFDPLLLERLGIVIPDDARALDADSRALLGRRGRRGLRWWSDGRGARDPRRWRSHPQLVAVSVTFGLLALTVALAASLIGVLTPRGADVVPPGGYALATDTVAAPGLVGGLLPDTGAELDGTTGVSARSLRPAVLLVVPAGACAGCADLLTAIHRQAREYGIDVYAVAALGRVDAARALLHGSGASSAHLLVDPAGALTAAYGGAEPRVVLVHADGVVGDLLRDPSTTARFEQLLAPLRLPGAPPSLRPAATAH